MHTAIAELEQAQLRTDVPDFRPGDTLKVHVKVTEGNRSRIQVFQGVVIRRQGGGLRETFTARKISFGVGVERTFPVHSPTIARIEVVSRGRVRRAKLYYLRERRGKRARTRERREPITTRAAATARTVHGAEPEQGQPMASGPSVEPEGEVTEPHGEPEPAPTAASAPVGDAARRYEVPATFFAGSDSGAKKKSERQKGTLAF